MGRATVWAIFSQTHLVTLLTLFQFFCRHPFQDQPFHKEMAIRTDEAFCIMLGA
jgi:hypothetical protein